jgi:hypothetical protein
VLSGQAVTRPAVAAASWRPNTAVPGRRP